MAALTGNGVVTRWAGRIRALTERLRTSLWFVPAVMTAASVVLAFITIWADSSLIPLDARAKLWFLFGVGAEGVRGVLAAIAGSIITVTGVVFSINVVALQLASTQYTPRVIRTFLEDRSNHAVLGVFISTFTYSLIILRTVRAETDRLAAFIPSISVTVALVMGLTSIGCLIYFVNHIAQSIRASAIVARLTDDAVRVARESFTAPPSAAQAAGARNDPSPGESPSSRAKPLTAPDDPCIEVRSRKRGYLQYIDERALLALRCDGGMAIHVLPAVGDFVRTGDVIARVFDAPADVHDDIGGAVADALTLGTEPTTQQDITLGITRLTDVAVRALSPGVNDPTTAAMCIDSLGEVLVVIGSGHAAPADQRDEDTCTRLRLRRYAFDELAALAFAPLRHHGTADPYIARQLLRLAGDVGIRVPPAHRDVLAREASLVLRAAGQRLTDEHERELIRREADEQMARLRHAPPARPRVMR